MKYIVILLLLVFLSAGICFYVLFGQKTAADKNGKISPKTEAAVEHKLIYLKNNNIYVYNISKKTQIQVTEDAGRLYSYGLPIWIDNSNYSYVRCQHFDEKDSQPYSCSIIKNDLNSKIPQTLVTYQSKANSDNVQRGASFSVVKWSHDKSLLAYLVVNYTNSAKDFGVTELHIYNLGTQNDNLLFTHLNTNGRAVGLNDDVSLHFSPDDSKLILNFTPLYPGGTNTVDNGTLLVFNLDQGTIVWKKPLTWTAFGNWFNDTSFIAKQFSLSRPAANLQNAEMLTISLSGDQKATISAQAKDWYNFLPTPDGNVFYWQANSQKGNGLTFNKINLKSKQTIKQGDNFIGLKVLDDGLVAVQILEKCSNEENSEKPPTCGTDMFNGYTFNGSGIFDPKTEQLTKFDIVKDKSGFNVTNADAI